MICWKGRYSGMFCAGLSDPMSAFTTETDYQEPLAVGVDDSTMAASRSEVKFSKNLLIRDSWRDCI